MMTQDIQEENDALEKQRLNLEAMSHELTNKLNIMIAQQEARVQQFISVETNESQIPTDVPTPPAPQNKVAFTVTRPVQSPPPLPKSKPKAQTQPSYLQQRLEEFYAENEEDVEETKEENTVGVGRVIAFIIFFIVISRACSG